MTMREADRIKTIEAVASKDLRPGVAAARLKLSTRQIERLVLRFRAEGVAGLVCRSRGRTGNRQLAPGVAELALGILRDRYPDFGPTFAAEKLAECHGLVICKDTVRRLMMEAGLWVPSRHRKVQVHQPRPRRHCLGEMIQIDGSDHRWFEERGPACTLLVYVDDATSRLMHLHFTFTESTFSYFEATRGYLAQHGKPLSFYSDKASVFRVNNVNATGGIGHTQFARAMYELNIETICAETSEAKGRVERSNMTLQDRLVKEMRLLGISTMQEGNAYAPAFMAKYNAMFAVAPRSAVNANRPVRTDEDLALIFTVRNKRKVSQQLTLQYDKTLYLLTDSPLARKCVGKYIDFYEYPTGLIEVRAGGVALPFITYDKLSAIDQAAVTDNKRLGHILEIAKLVQAGRDDRRSGASPSRRNQGLPVVEKRAAPGTKSARQLNSDDLANAIRTTAKARLEGDNPPVKVDRRTVQGRTNQFR